MTDTTTRTEADAVAQVAREAAAPKPMEGGVWALPPGVTTLDLTDQLARYENRPARRRGRVAVTDDASLSRLVKDLGPEHGQVRIYADILDDTPTITAVLNDHEGEGAELVDGLAGWGDHRITLQIRRTPSWEAWLALNNRMTGQVDFAQHIEDNLRDVASPDGADLLEMALTFEQTTSAEFKTAMRLNDGNRQLTYVETTDQTAGRSGQMTIPEWITLLLPPFEGSEPVRIEARLRTYARDGKLTIGYRIDKPEEIERAALDSIVERVAAATSIDPYRAKPPVA